MQANNSITSKSTGKQSKQMPKAGKARNQKIAMAAAAKSETKQAARQTKIM